MSHRVFLLTVFLVLTLFFTGVFTTHHVPGELTFTEKEQTPIEVWDPKHLTWSLATSTAPWQPRDSGTAFVFNNKIWMLGGLDGNGHIVNGVEHYWEAPHFNDIWSTTDGATWILEREHADFPPRRSASVIEFKGKLWMFGGYSPLGGLRSDIWQSTDGVNWSEITDKAAFGPREGQTIEVFRDRLWMIGGVDYGSRRALAEVWYSDNGADWYKSTSTIPWSPRWDHDTEIWNGKMYLASGMDLTLKTFNDIWVSDDGFEWRLVAVHAPWHPRQGGQLIAFRDYLWIIGRLNDEFDGFGPNDVWFTKDGANWEKTLTDPGWTGREDHFGLLYNGKIYIFGGMDADWKWRNDVWVSSE